METYSGQAILIDLLMRTSFDIEAAIEAGLQQSFCFCNTGYARGGCMSLHFVLSCQTELEDYIPLTEYSRINILLMLFFELPIILFYNSLWYKQALKSSYKKYIDSQPSFVV